MSMVSFMVMFKHRPTYHIQYQRPKEKRNKNQFHAIESWSKTSKVKKVTKVKKNTHATIWTSSSYSSSADQSRKLDVLYHANVSFISMGHVVVVVHFTTWANQLV